MTPAEFEQKCRDLCPHCAAGEVVRLRTDTNEWVHDFSFGGPPAGTPFGRRQLGHGICMANSFRAQWKDSLSG